MNYWLFKTEPDVYGIADLAAEPGKPVRWDGIRNYQARNYLRDRVAAGDPVFIYHAGCRIPGVAGIAEVAQAVYADPGQFDSENSGYDARSDPKAPRWYCVDVLHRRTFAPLIPAERLKTLPELANMVLFRQGRLSVQPVTEEEWHTIVDLADNS